MLYNALSVVKQPPNLPLSPWYFVTLPKEVRATVIGNMQKKLVKVVRVVAEIYPRRHTHTHTHTHSSQYFAAAPVGGIIRNETLERIKI